MAKKGVIKGRRKTRGETVRPVRWRKYEQLCLIVCEDEKTEPAYFRLFENLFPDETFYLRCIGTGKDALGVVEAAIKEKQLLEIESKKEVDFTWAVFDKDDLDLNNTRLKRFNDAYIAANDQNITPILSNEVFELWLLLHFKEIDSGKPIPRIDVYYQLEQEIRRQADMTEYQYQHGDSSIVQYIIEYGSESEAILRARNLDDHFGQCDPIIANPSTRIYLIVEFLRDYIAYHNWEKDS